MYLKNVRDLLAWTRAQLARAVVLSIITCKGLAYEGCSYANSKLHYNIV